MPSRMINELERIRYRNGQTLASRDLRDGQDFEALLRWMHNRFLHRTWGIAKGLQVKSLDNETIQVSPGTAYDGYGREIILTRPVNIRLPVWNMNEVNDLVIRYKESNEFPGRQALESVFLTEHSDQSGNTIFPPMLEQPVFLWRGSGMAQLGKEIPVARVRRNQVMTLPSVEYSIRRNTYTPARPHIGYGSVSFDLQSMILWTERTDNVERAIGFQIEIDTTPVGFVQTPCYMFMARIRVSFDQIDLTLPVPAFQSIANPRPDGFTYRIMIGASLFPRLSKNLQSPAQFCSDVKNYLVTTQLVPPRARTAELFLKITVEWMGIDHG
jgi:hypothetical protein